MLLSIDPVSIQKFWFGIAFVSIALGLLTWGLFGQFRKLRLVKDTPTSLLRSAAQGFVEIKATVCADQPTVISPYSGRTCVWFRCDTYQRERHSKNNTNWRKISSRESPQWFRIEDTTDEAWVNSIGAEVETTHLKRWQGAASDRQHPFTTNINSADEYRFEEQLIKAEDPLYALGQFSTVSAERARNEQLDGIATNFGDRTTLNLIQNPERPGYPFILSTTSESKQIKARSVRMTVMGILMVIALWGLLEWMVVPIQ